MHLLLEEQACSIPPEEGGDGVTKIFPSIIIALNVGAAITYCGSDWRKAVFFGCSAAIIFVVTWP